MPSIQRKGERALVEFALHQMKDTSPLLPRGDDAAALPLEDGRVLVLKTDFLAGLTDVPSGMSPRQVGWKAVTMNISDLAAKGATPLAMLFSVAFPRDYPYEEAQELIEALFEASAFYGAENLGGDTGESEGLVVAGMAVGLAKPTQLVPRSGAKPGDILAVTGEFGYTSLGLKLLKSRRKLRGSAERSAVNKVLNPRARLREGLALARARVLSSSMDSSDGLAWSLHELSKASRVGFMVNSLPIGYAFERYAREKRLDRFKLAFYGGEEYELVVTIPRENWQKAERTARKAEGRLIRIGKATRGSGVIWESRGREKRIEAKGYEHFRGQPRRQSA